MKAEFHNLSVLLLSVLCLNLAGNVGVMAGPACARRYKNQQACMSKCAARWGWPGHQMGTDPWGVVMQPSSNPSTTVQAAACGQTSSASSNPAAGYSVAAGAYGATNVPEGVGAEPTVSSAATSASTTAVSATTSTSSSSSTSTSTSSSSSATAASSQGFLVSTHGDATTSTPPPATTSAPPKTSQAPPPPPKTSAAPPPAKSSSQAPAPAATPNSDSSSSSSSGSSTSSPDIQQYLSAHNTVRAQHGASALTWNNELASKAQQWANGCQFKHSGGTLGPFGENLAAGTGNDYDIAAAIKSWTDEVSQYNPENPEPSHFTQVVWKASTQVGCALQMCNGIFAASFGEAKYFVCEYSVQGNVIGQFPQNVQA